MNKPPSSEILLSARGIKKSYFKGGVELPIIKGVDFDLQKGEMVAIRGASGVGKSTLLHVLGTLDRPTKGRVYFGPEKKEVFGFSDKVLSEFRNKSLGFVFQFHYLLPEFTAYENVMMPALIAGHTVSVAEKQAKMLLDFVGLSHRMHHRPTEMSGGEQQRVAVARAVILRPDLILADEPTGNLDSGNSHMVMDLMVRLNQSMGVGVLLVTHDVELANRMHRTMIMKDGVFV